MRNPSPIADVVMHPVRLRIIQQVGTREITTAVIATTISLIAVFAPLLFLTGATGRLFSQVQTVAMSAVLLTMALVLWWWAEA